MTSPLGSRAAMRVGSNPTTRTTSEQALYRLLRLILSVRARSRRCSSFPNRNRSRWAAGLGPPLRGGFAFSLENIDFNRLFQNKRQLRKQLTFILGSAAPRAAPPFGISMLRAAKPPFRLLAKIQEHAGRYCIIKP